VEWIPDEEVPGGTLRAIGSRRYRCRLSAGTSPYAAERRPRAPWTNSQPAYPARHRAMASDAPRLTSARRPAYLVNQFSCASERPIRLWSALIGLITIMIVRVYRTDLLPAARSGSCAAWRIRVIPDHRSFGPAARCCGSQRDRANSNLGLVDKLADSLT